VATPAIGRRDSQIFRVLHTNHAYDMALPITVLQMLDRTARMRQWTSNSLQNIAIISHPTAGKDVQP